MIRSTDVLLVIDVQNDFVPGGALPVPQGDEVVPLINGIARRFANVILTQDWHPRRHVSFASSHPNTKPFDRIKLRYGEQILWPDHCVQGTDGAAFHPALAIPHAQLVLRKGYHDHTDSYSAFLEADRKTKTGLDGFLRARGFKRVFCAGLATDFCVAWSAIDARKFGFSAVMIEDACREIDTDGSLDDAWRKLRAARVQRINSMDL